LKNAAYAEDARAETGIYMIRSFPTTSAHQSDQYPNNLAANHVAQTHIDFRQKPQ
jgi:hypothetical protein